MAITYNGNAINNVTFNGNNLNKVTYNGNTVWEKSTEYTITYNFPYLTRGAGQIINNRTGEVKRSGNGTGTITAQAGDVITVSSSCTADTAYDVWASIYVGSNRVSYEHKQGISTTASTTYNYTISRNISVTANFSSTTSTDSVTTTITEA